MYKKIPQSPLTGILDFRSPVEDLDYSAWRFRENFSCSGPGKLARMAGWEKLLSRSTAYGNMDLHDQLLPLQEYYEKKKPFLVALGSDVTSAEQLSADERFAREEANVSSWPNSTYCKDELLFRTRGREPITFSMEFVGTSGARKLIVGTQSRLYLANTVGRNWRVLADGFGGQERSDLSVRWHGDTLKDIAVFTNGFDAPVQWPLNGGPKGCNIRSVLPIPDLALIGLTKAEIAVQFKGCMFLFNIVLDGQRIANGYVNSDLNDATSYDPAKADSIADQEELPGSNGEAVLNAMVLGDELIVYTDRAIYIGSATGDPDLPFSFREHYRGEKTLYYKNTLVNAGTEHYYGGKDTIYSFSTYRRDPVAVDWIHKAAGIVYNGAGAYGKINAACCASHTAGFRHSTDTETQVWFSWAEEGSCVPSKTIVLDLRYEFASTVDAGFTSFVSYRVDNRPSFRDWLLQYCACSVAELQALGLDFTKEGQPINLCSGDLVQSIRTTTLGTSFGVTTEDWAKDPADPDSFCALLAGRRLDEFCKECSAAAAIFIGALSEDFCLKQIGSAYVREVCTNVNTPTGDGTDYPNVNGVYYSFPGQYVLRGYDSLSITSANAFGSLSQDKNIKYLQLDATPEDQIDPCVVQIRIGYTYSARDPSALNCGVLWSRPVRNLFKCPLTKTPEQYQSVNQRPDNMINFPLYATGLFLYTEIRICGLADQNNISGNLVPAVGGAGVLTAVYHEVELR